LSRHRRAYFDQSKQRTVYVAEDTLSPRKRKKPKKKKAAKGGVERGVLHATVSAPSDIATAVIVRPALRSTPTVIRNLGSAAPSRDVSEDDVRLLSALSLSLSVVTVPTFFFCVAPACVCA
jgi:hypothetical protein